MPVPFIHSTRPTLEATELDANFAACVSSDGSGNVQLGSGAPTGFRLAVAADTDPLLVKVTGVPGAACFIGWQSAVSGNNTFVNFGTEGTFTIRGSITYNRAGGLVAFNTTSDYRAKTIHGPLTNSGAIIDGLPVYMGTMNGATQARPMFVAHEVQAVAPYAVTGEKDAIGNGGAPILQQLDASSLVPILVAEIKSLRARVAALES